MLQTLRGIIKARFLKNERRHVSLELFEPTTSICAQIILFKLHTKFMEVSFFHINPAFYTAMLISESCCL